MLIVGADKLATFGRRHADARTRLSRWQDVVEAAFWTRWLEVRATFPSADLVHRGKTSYVVFNVGGNDYRVSAIIQYAAGVVFVDRAMTHEEYSRWSRT